MPRISESLPVFLALASLAPPDRTNAFTSSNGGHNKGRIRTGYYRDSKSHGHNDGRRIALDEEVLEGPYVRRHERPTPQQDDEGPSQEFNPYLNNLGISHRLPMHQRPLKGGGGTSGLNPTDVLSGGSNSMSRTPAQSQQFHDRTSEVAGYSNQQPQQPPPGPPQPPKEFTWSSEANLPNTGPPPIPPDNNVNGGAAAASSPAFYPNENTGGDQDVLDAVAQPFDASTRNKADPYTFYPDANVNVNGSQQQQQQGSNPASPQQPPPTTPRRPQTTRNPYLGNGSNARKQPPKNPFNTPSRPNFHGITSAPFSFAKDAGASYWNELSYVEQQREKARLAEEEVRRQEAEHEAQIMEERRRREEAQREEALRLEQEAARLEQEKKNLEQEQKAEAERLRKEAAEIEAEKQRIAESKRIQKEEEERLRRETELEKLRLHKEYQARLAEEEAKRKQIEKDEEERARIVAEIETQRLQKEQEDRIAAEVARQVAEANRIAEAKRVAEEEARQAEEKKRQQEEQDRIAAELAEQERLTEELRLADEKRKLEEARLAEAEVERKRVQEEQERTAAKLAEEQRLAEELRVAEEKRKEEEARLVAETQRKRLADEEQAKKKESQREALRKEEEKARLLQEATRAEARLADEYEKSSEQDSPETDTLKDPRTEAQVGSSGAVADKSLTPLEKKYAAETARSNPNTDESNAADSFRNDFVSEESFSSESELLEEARLAESTLVAEKRKIQEAKAEYIRKFEQKLATEATQAESKLLEEKRQAQKSSEAKSDTTPTPVSSSDSVNRGVDGRNDNVSGKSLTPLEKKFITGATQSDNAGAPSRNRPTVIKPTAPQTRSEMEELDDEESSFQPTPPQRPPTAFEKSRPVSYSVKTRQATSTPVFPKRSPKLADTAVLVKRIQQGDRQGRGKAGVLIDENGLTLEERIASTITDATKDITATKRTYETTRENLRGFKSNTQRRLSRSAREKEKAAEKVADIKIRMQEKIREVEEQLEATLSKTQDKIDEEVSRIVVLLVSEIELEVKRQEDMVQLMDSLQDLVAAKECDIAEDKKIANEMIDVRSKLKDGLIAENIDKEVEQKLSVAAIDQELVNDLFGCLIDLQSLLEDAQDRSASTSQSLDDFVRPETRESNPYDWSDIEKMELVFEQAADNVAGAETRIRDLSARIDSALVDKVLVLGEDVPPGMAKLARKAAARGSIKKAITSADIDMDELDLEGVMELQGKNEKELLSMLGKSVGSATVDGSKAAAFSLKSMIDSMTGKAVGDTAGQNENELEEGEDDSSEIVASGDSTDEGSTTSGEWHSDSSEAANDALKETTKGLLDSLKAAAALSVKMFRGQ